MDDIVISCEVETIRQTYAMHNNVIGFNVNKIKLMDFSRIYFLL